MNSQCTITGHQEVIRNLHNLPPAVGVKAMIGSVRKVMNTAKRDAQTKLIQNKSIRSGLLLRSIDTTIKIMGKVAAVWGGVGINKRVRGVNLKGKPHWPIKIAHNVERKKPFLEPSWNAGEGRIMDTMVKFFQTQINKHTKAQ